MLSKFISLLTLTSAALAETSPLFMLASTTQLPFYSQDFQPNPPAIHVSHLLYRSLSTCPTKHYAVIVEPQSLNYTSSSSFLPGARNAATTYVASHLDGSMNVNHILNTILMDCLHHGVLHVEELDTTSLALPALSRETVRGNIIYARLPDLNVMRREQYLDIVRGRREYVERLLETYYDDEDYTLIYIREQMVTVNEKMFEIGGDEDEGFEHDDGMEVPLLEIEELRM